MSRHEAIAAARRVISSLARPLPDLPSGLTMTSNRLLSQELPLADVSPFAALPEADSEPGRKPLSEERRNRSEFPQREGARPVRAAAAVPDRTGADSKLPAFSFRRPSEKAVTRAASGKPVTAAQPELPARPVAPAAAELTVTRPSDARVELVQSRSPLETSRVAEALERPVVRTKTAMALVDEMASEILSAAVQAAARPAPGAPNAESPGRGAQPSSTAHENLLPGHTTAHNGLALAESVPPAQFAMELAGPRHPEAMLPELASPISHSALHDLPVHASGLPSSPVHAIIPAAAGAALDGETLASLVNEVLAEQARRHGVDLS